MREGEVGGGSNEKNNLAFAEKKKIEEMNNKLKLENRVKNAIFSRNNFNQNQKLVAENSTPKRPENDSRFTNFVRGFRRENTDFFPLSKRHSAILGGEQSPAKSNSPQKMQRSSAIFQRNRPKGEPILTDFIPKRDNTLDNKLKNSNSNNSPGGANRNSEVKLRNPSGSSSNNNELHRMRREKTESVIFVSSRNSNALNINADNLQQIQQVKDLRNAGLINAS